MERQSHWPRHFARLNDGGATPRFRWLHLLDTHAPCLRGGGGIACYRKEMRHVSREFGRLWSALQNTERGRRAVVIFISDHGEEFGDHAGSHAALDG